LPIFDSCKCTFTTDLVYRPYNTVSLFAMFTDS